MYIDSQLKTVLEQKDDLAMMLDCLSQAPEAKIVLRNGLCCLHERDPFQDAEKNWVTRRCEAAVSEM